jgi:hypothetical protein
MERETNTIIQREDPDWKKLEKVIAEIQEALAPDAEVKHNDHIRGKSGTIRKLDVSIKGKIGINPILIDIDAKHHSRPVSRKDVAGFYEQVEDLGPNCIGIMISDLGYDSGAIQVAERFNITLKTFTEATETDWKQICKSSVLLWITSGEWKIHGAWMPEFHVGGIISQNLVPLDPGTALFTADKKYHPINPSGCVIGDLFAVYYERMERPRPLGRFKVQIPQTAPPYHIWFEDDRLIIPPYVIVEGTIVQKRYPITYEMAKGRALKSDTGMIEAMKVITNGFTADDLITGKEGIVLTQEDWEKQERENLLSFERRKNYVYTIEFLATPKD